MNDTNFAPCPVCETLSFLIEDFPGSYEICEVFGGEDDTVQFVDSDFER